MDKIKSLDYVPNRNQQFHLEPNRIYHTNTASLCKFKSNSQKTYYDFFLFKDEYMFLNLKPHLQHLLTRAFGGYYWIGRFSEKDQIA